MQSPLIRLPKRQQRRGLPFEPYHRQPRLTEVDAFVISGNVYHSQPHTEGLTSYTLQ